MIILSIGSNLSSKWGGRMQTLNTAIKEMQKLDIELVKKSQPYFSAPMGLSSTKSTATKTDLIYEQLPEFHYVNMTLAIKTSLPANQLLYNLKQIEKAAGRVKGQRWAARPLDMDIIDYNGLIIGNKIEYNQKQHAGHLPLSLPHPGLAKRAFVLEPLMEIAPFWHDPRTGKTARQLLNRLK